VRDYARAAEWCERVTVFCRRWHFASMFAVCRIQFASVLLARGQWEQAETELQAALGDFEALRPALAGSALTRLALLRVRQGSLEEAEALAARAPSHRLEPLVQAELALARGDAAGARDHAGRYLERVGASDRTDRVAGLELLALAAARAGDLAGAAEAARELREIAEIVDTDALHGAAQAAAGDIEEDGRVAMTLLREAAESFDRAGMPWNAARARCALATVLAHEGATADARREAADAASTFERLGAARDAVVARRLAGDPTRLIEIAAIPAARTAGPSPLSPREREVLRHLAEGAADRDVAERLFLSPHTVHRHVANILVKLDVPSRAAAVAAASRLGLLA
jgi:DNA-binding CsgD family transcriptional regulator